MSMISSETKSRGEGQIRYSGILFWVTVSRDVSTSRELLSNMISVIVVTMSYVKFAK